LGVGGGRNRERRRGGGRRGGGAKNTAAERTALVFVVRGEKIELKKTETKSESNLNLETREAKKQSDLSGRFLIRAMEGGGCFEIGDGSFRFFIHLFASIQSMCKVHWWLWMCTLWLGRF
jgi:hypothetical protein